MATMETITPTPMITEVRMCSYRKICRFQYTDSPSRRLIFSLSSLWRPFKDIKSLSKLQVVLELQPPLGLHFRSYIVTVLSWDRLWFDDIFLHFFLANSTVVWVPNGWFFWCKPAKKKILIANCRWLCDIATGPKNKSIPKHPNVVPWLQREMLAQQFSNCQMWFQTVVKRWVITRNLPVFQGQRQHCVHT